MSFLIPDKIRSLINCIESAAKFSNQDIIITLNELNIGYSDLEAHLAFEHPGSESYGRSVLYNSPKLEIVVMSWCKEDYTSIHDHGYAQWGAVLCLGQVQHTNFKLLNNNLIISDKETIQNGEIIMVSNQLIHQMGNPFNKPAVSLHIYGSDAPVAGVTTEARNYDPVNGNVIYANGGAFLEIAKQNILKEESCPLVQDDIFHDSVKILLNYRKKSDNKKLVENTFSNTIS